MRWSFYIKEHHSDDSFFWKHLCVVFDNEAFGILERILSNQNIEYEVRKVD